MKGARVSARSVLVPVRQASPGPLLPAPRRRLAPPGLSGRAKNTIWANDGVSERRVPESELANMPGWVRGQISHRGFDNYRMRTYRTIEFEGRLVTQTELAQLLKTTQKRVSRLLESGLAAKEMAAVIAADRAKRHPLIPFQGGMFRISELERMTGVSRGAIQKDLSKGLTADEVIAMRKAKRPAAEAS